MELAANLFIAPERAPASGIGREREIAVPLNKEAEGKKFKDFLLENPGQDKDSFLEKFQERLKELLALEPDFLEKKLAELKGEFPEEFTALLNLSLDYLIQQLQPAFPTYTPGELKEILLAIRDSAREHLLQLASTGGKVEQEASLYANALRGKSLKPHLNNAIGEGLLEEEGVVEVSGDRLVETERENTFLAVNTGKERTNAGDIIQTEGDINPLTGTGQLLEEGQQEAEKLSARTRSAGKEARPLQDLLQDNSAREAAVAAEGDRVVVPADLKSNSLETANRLWLFNEESQFSNGQAELRESFTRDSNNSEGQSAFFLDRSSWIESFAAVNGKESAQASEADLEGIIEQISQRMQIQRQEGRSRIELQLEPKSLGQVKLELEVENSALRARLLVENEQVRNYLEQNLDSLKSSLVRQGFDIGEIQIESRELAYQEHNYPQEDFRQDQGHGGKDKRGRNSFLAEEVETLEGREKALGISEFVGEEGVLTGPPRWVHLNYSRHRMNLLA